MMTKGFHKYVVALTTGQLLMSSQHMGQIKESLFESLNDKLYGVILFGILYFGNIWWMKAYYVPQQCTNLLL